EHGGLKRSYYLHVPAGIDPLSQVATPADRVPLVVVLHGRGGNGPSTADLTGFDEVADENGFIVVYPTGVDNQWNYVDGIPGYDFDVPDRAFLRELVAEL